MPLIPYRDGQIHLCQDAPAHCPIPCGLSITWTPCNQATITSTLTGFATYSLALDVQFFTLCAYQIFGLPGKNTDLFWLVANATPSEIQEAGGGYALPIPGLPDPATGVCRFVWQVLTGRGNFYLSLADGFPDITTAPNTSTPTACRRDEETFSHYAWLAYVDAQKCSGLVISDGVVADAEYNFGGWPLNPDDFGCGCSLMGSNCDSFAPAISVAQRFLPDCCP